MTCLSQVWSDGAPDTAEGPSPSLASYLQTLKALAEHPTTESMREHLELKATQQRILSTEAGVVRELRLDDPVGNTQPIVAASAVIEEFGGDAVAPRQQSWSGKDPAGFTLEILGSYVRHDVCGTDPGRPMPDLHIAHFDVRERAVDLGGRLPVATTKGCFEGGKAP